MAQPFPTNSSFPSLIDFGDDDHNEDLPSSFEPWNLGFNAEHDYRSLEINDHHIMVRNKQSSSSSGFKGRFKGSDSRSSSSSLEFDPRDGSSGSGCRGQNDGHVELRDQEEHHHPHHRHHHSQSNEEATPQSTLDLFLSSPHPNFRSPLPGIYDDEAPPPYPSASSPNVYTSMEKPPSRSGHGKPISNRISDNETLLHYPSEASHVSFSTEKPPSRSDHGKPSIASSLGSRTYDNEPTFPYLQAPSHVSPSMEKPPSKSDHGKPSIAFSSGSRTYDNEPTFPYPQAPSHVSPMEKPPSRSDHGKPGTASSSCNVIYNDERPPAYSPAESHVNPSMEKPPSRSDHGKLSIASSSCDRIPEDKAINLGFPSITSQSEPIDSPESALGGSNRSTDAGFSASEDEDPWARSCGEVEKMGDGAGDSVERFGAIYSVPGHRKSCSYGQQFDNDMQGRRNTMRKHSLDERMPKYLNTCEEMYPVIGDMDEFKSQFLDKSGDEDPGLMESLPEFIGNGGGNGIFKVPVRAAVHPGRPPALELRPHPLRETQTGCFLRTIVCTDSQLWAGQESGVRFWNLSDVFGEGAEGSQPKGDEETAPFQESAAASPTLCLLSDAANRLIWSGHKDGKIRSWKMDQALDGSLFKEGLSWQAHRAPVISIVMTSYGDIWSGSEGGAIRVWPWEAMEKSLSLTPEERHMASLLVERSYIDLRNQVTVNGVCAIPASDVRYLVSDNCRAKVWSGGSFSFALWDARTRDLLKVFGSDGQAEIRVDMSSAQDPSVEDEMKVKFVTTTKKEKTQGSLSFFQRSRNALMGAADAVRRAAAKGPFGDESRRVDAIITSVDGMIWTGSANGLLVQWDGNGNRLQEFHHHSFSVQCLFSCGPRMWIGYASGTVQVMDLDGKLLGGWVAHSCSVIKMAVGGSYLFTLAAHGGIHAWNLISPGPIDNILRSELSKKELLYMKHETLKILTGTWNVGQERASQDSLISWLGSCASDVGIVVVGLQEVEMGAGFLAMAAAKETVGLEGSANGQWWLDTIGKTLDEGATFERVGSRQLAGLLIAIWARKTLRPHVGDVDAAAVPCGFGRAIGNKGAVGLKMRVYSRIICFVNCHFAAHLEAINRRNADFDHVYRTMVFSRPSNGANAVPVQLLRGVNVPGSHLDDGRPELSEADMIIFLGDFNYRLQGISYDEARDFVSQRSFDWLREKDQLRAEMKAGKVFQGMREGPIKFPPTYKFERHQTGLQGYDSSEKKRIPAWCDRILFRDGRTSSSTGCTLECPVVSSILHYDACMDVTDSDHKPVRCIFNVDIARVDERIRRREFGNIVTSSEKIKLMLEEYCNVPETVVSTNNIILQNQDTSILRITNKCAKKKAAFEIICEGQSTIKEGGLVSEHQTRGSFGFSRWLEVIPAAGIVKPGQIVEVAVHHEEFHTQEEFVDGVPQNWWCEDTRDKEVILVVNVRGSCMTEVKNHRIRVRHCFSSKTLRIDSKGGGAKRVAAVQSNHLLRSDFRSLGSSSDVVDDLRSMRSP